MKTSIAIILGIMISASPFYKKKEYKFFEKPAQTENVSTEKAPGSPGDPLPAPIDDYIPLLMVAGGALIFYYGRKVRAYSRD